MIYFVDEDFGAYESWIAELELRGFHVKSLRSADEAFAALWGIALEDVELVIVDVMLAVDDIDDPKFSVELTDGYLESGLRLLENLVQQNPNVFPQRAVLLTNTINDKTLGAAADVSKRYAIELWDKREIMSPLYFGDRVEAAIEGAGKV